MKLLPATYVLRSLWVRKVTTLLTVLGMALVVFTWAAVLMMSEGVRGTLVATGTPGNLVLLRRGAGAEVYSAIDREQAALIGNLPAIATDAQGTRLVVSELVVLNQLAYRGAIGAGSVIVRGTSEQALALRPQVRLAEGRMFRPGTLEIVAGRAVARRHAGVAVGQTLHLAGRDWMLVGLIDGGGSAFDSELWADAGQVKQAYRRDTWSVVVLALADPQDEASAIGTLEADRRLGVQARAEKTFYGEQSAQLTGFIRVLGLSLSVIFSVGAAAGAMITMLAAVANRTVEIGTLRAIGYTRAAVLLAFLAEALALAMLGGLLGMAAAAGLQRLEMSTTNLQTLSELAFSFRLTPPIAAASLLFAAAMGLLGGLLPAWRAARADIVEALCAR